jgi:hypothetical protein
LTSSSDGPFREANQLPAAFHAPFSELPSFASSLQNLNKKYRDTNPKSKVPSENHPPSSITLACVVVAKTF